MALGGSIFDGRYYHGLLDDFQAYNRLLNDDEIRRLFENPGLSLAEIPVFGDMNCDGLVSVSDIGGFVLALTDPVGYAAQFPDCDVSNADINDDDIVSVSDIGPFVALLTGG
ncbi:MAG: hypothetical protein AB7N71_14000 [Phycisphaerae bacterium]